MTLAVKFIYNCLTWGSLKRWSLYRQLSSEQLDIPVSPKHKHKTTINTLRNYNKIYVPRQHKQLCFRPEQVQTLQLSAVSQVAPAATLVPLVSLWNSTAPVIGQNGNTCSTNLLIGQTRNSTIFSLVSLICIISKCRLFCMKSILF